MNHQLILSHLNREDLATTNTHLSNSIIHILNSSQQTPPDWHWDELGDITFHIRDHQAWTIIELGKETRYLWADLPESLAQKLSAFCIKVVGDAGPTMINAAGTR